MVFPMLFRLFPDEFFYRFCRLFFYRFRPFLDQFLRFFWPISQSRSPPLPPPKKKKTNPLGSPILSFSIKDRYKIDFPMPTAKIWIHIFNFTQKNMHFKKNTFFDPTKLDKYQIFKVWNYLQRNYSHKCV